MALFKSVQLNSVFLARTYGIMENLGFWIQENSVLSLIR